MDNSTTTLQGEILLINQFELITPTTVAGTLYGIAFALFCLYIHSLVPRLRDEDRKRQARFMLGYSSVVMLCGLYILVGSAWGIQDVYIKHSSYPGGPSAYEFTTYHTPPVIIILACELAVDTLTLAIQVWRVWVIWSSTRYSYFVIVLPLLCFFTSTGLSLRLVLLDAILPMATIPLLPVTRGSKLKVELQTLFQAVATILCTTFISLFLVIWQWRQRNLIGKALGSAKYMKIVAVLIESYALESIWVLLSALLVMHPFVGVFLSEAKFYIEIIAYLLVQYRVASGKAYESQREQDKISSLRWNHYNHATTQFRETGELEAGGHHDVSAKPQVASDVLPTSSPA